MSALYSNFKFALYSDRIRAVRDRSPVAPVHVRLKPINHCNHDCWYCAYRVSNLQLGKDMDLRDRIPEDKMAEIVEDIVDMGVEAVTFSGGGEPLLYKTLPQHIKRLGEGGVKVASLTNASNLKGRMAEAFAEHGTWIRVSMDGWDDDSYAKARNVPVGAFSTIVDNMRAFTALKSRCVLGASYIVDQANSAHVYEFCALMKDVGVNHVRVAGAVVSNSPGEQNAYHKDIFDDVMAQIDRAEGLVDDVFGLVNHYHEMESRFDKDYDFCPYLQFQTVIGADSMVYACHDKAYNLDNGYLGSIKDRSFKEFWFSEENKRRMYAMDPSRDCGHHCTAHLKNLALLDLINLDREHATFV